MNGKEAIQILKNMNIEISGTSTCKECIYDDKTHCFRDGKDCQMQAIETLLNLLEKKNKQIEQYQNMLATNDMLHVLECEKKDKIIDLMAEEISKNILNTCPLADYNVDLDCENKCQDNYKECWKQYFEKKVEG